MRKRYPEVLRAQVPGSYKPLHAFRLHHIPRANRTGKEVWGATLFLGTLAAVAILALGAWRAAPGWFGLLLGLAAAGFTIREAARLNGRMEGEMWQRLKEGDERTLRPALDGERHVGIAYCYGIWTIHSEDSWDRGYMRSSDGWLHFRGHGSSFMLPLSSIENVRLAAVPELFKATIPRLYFDWVHPDTGRNVVGLELLPTAPASKMVREMEALEHWLQEEVRRARTVDDADAIWPFQSALLDFAANPDLQQVTSKDRVVSWIFAVGATVPVFALLSLLDGVFHTRISSYAGGLAGGLIIYVSNTVLLARVRRRRNEVGSVSQLAGRTRNGG